MRLNAVVGWLALSILPPGVSVAQTVLTDEEYFRTLDDAAGSCVYFVALNHLPKYNPDIAEDILIATCKAVLDKFDAEGCRIESTSDNPAEIADCTAAKIYSDVHVTSAVNLMRMIGQARKP